MAAPWRCARPPPIPATLCILNYPSQRAQLEPPSLHPRQPLACRRSSLRLRLRSLALSTDRSAPMSLFSSAQRWFSGLRLRASSSFLSLAAKKRCVPSHGDRIAACTAGAERTTIATPAVASPAAASPTITEPKICVYFPRNDPDALPPTISPAAMKRRTENQATYLVQALVCAFDRAAVREIDGQSHTAKRKSVQAALTHGAADLDSRASTSTPASAASRPQAELKMAYESQSSTASESSDASHSVHRSASQPMMAARPTRTPAVTAAERTSAPRFPRVPLRQRVLQYQQQLKLQQQQQEQPQQETSKSSAPSCSSTSAGSSISLRDYRVTNVAYQRPRVPVATGPTPQLDIDSRYNLYTHTAQFQAKRQQNLDLQRRLAARREQNAIDRANQAVLTSENTHTTVAAPAPAAAAAVAARSRTHSAIVISSDPRREVVARYMDYTQSARFQEKLQWNLERRRQLDARCQPNAPKRAHKLAHTSSSETMKIDAAASRPKAVASRLSAYRTDPRWLARRAENRERADKIGVVRTAKTVDPSPSHQLLRPSPPRCRVSLRLRMALRLTLAREFARELSLFQLLFLAQCAPLLASVDSRR